jgi:diaminopimelate decarboxylase
MEERQVHELALLAKDANLQAGTQIAEPEVYVEAVRGLVDTMTDVRANHGVVLTELNIGGGHAIAYRTGEPELDVPALAEFLEDALDAACAASLVAEITGAGKRMLTFTSMSSIEGRSIGTWVAAAPREPRFRGTVSIARRRATWRRTSRPTVSTTVARIGTEAGPPISPRRSSSTGSFRRST